MGTYIRFLLNQVQKLVDLEKRNPRPHSSAASAFLAFLNWHMPKWLFKRRRLGVIGKMCLDSNYQLMNQQAKCCPRFLAARGIAMHGLWLCQRYGAGRAEQNHINPKHVLLAARRLPFMDAQLSWSRLFAESRSLKPTSRPRSLLLWSSCAGHGWSFELGAKHRRRCERTGSLGLVTNERGRCEWITR